MGDKSMDAAEQQHVSQHIVTQDDDGNVIVLEVEKTDVDQTDIDLVQTQRDNQAKNVSTEDEKPLEMVVETPILDENPPTIKVVKIDSPVNKNSIETTQRKEYPRRERRQIYPSPKKQEQSHSINSNTKLTNQSTACDEVVVNNVTASDEIVVNNGIENFGKISTVNNACSKLNSVKSKISVKLGKRKTSPMQSKLNIIFKCNQCQKSFSSKTLHIEHEHKHFIDKNRQEAKEKYENEMSSTIMNPIFRSDNTVTKAVKRVVIKDIEETYTLDVIDIKKPLVKIDKCQLANVIDETFDREVSIPIQLVNNVTLAPTTITKTIKLGISNFPKINQDVSLKQFQCSQCNQRFKRPDYLRDHAITAHGGIKPFECDECGKGFIRRNVLENHMRSHTGERPFECNLCDKSFSHKSNLRSHLQLHSGERPYICEECGKTFCAKSNLMSHLKIHLGIKPHVCPHCDRAFIHMDTLKKHLMVHSDERPFQCTLCDKAFRRNTHLTIHMRHHNNDRPYQCELCEKSFFEKSLLQSHMTYHTGLKPFQCQLCDKAFCHRSTLNIHLQIHRGERLFHCSVCNKSFCDKTTLVRHFRIHTGEKPFQCDVCNLFFRQSSNLKRHMRIHTGERPYGCPYCEKLFAQNINLTNHIRVHTGEKPFVCGTCNKAFAQRSNLIAHQKSHMSGCADDNIVEIYADYPKQIENGNGIASSSIKIRGTDMSIALGEILPGDESEGNRKLQIVGQKISQNNDKNQANSFVRVIANNASKKVSSSDRDIMQSAISHVISKYINSSDSRGDHSNVVEYGSLVIDDEPAPDNPFGKLHYSKDNQGNIVVSLPTTSDNEGYIDVDEYEDDREEHDFVIGEATGDSCVDGSNVAVLSEDGIVVYLNEGGVDHVTAEKQVYIETATDGGLNIIQTDTNISERSDQTEADSQDEGMFVDGNIGVGYSNAGDVQDRTIIGQEMISEDVLRQVESYVVSNYNQETYDQLLNAAQQLPTSSRDVHGENAYYDENNYISTQEEIIESTEHDDSGNEILEVLQYAVSQTVETTHGDQ